MEPHDTKAIRTAWVILSMVWEINKAGGSVDLDKVMKMTVYDFIMNIAGPNNIKFKCDKPDD